MHFSITSYLVFFLETLEYNTTFIAFLPPVFSKRKKNGKRFALPFLLHHQGHFFGTRLIDELWGNVTDKCYGLHPALIRPRPN